MIDDRAQPSNGRWERPPPGREPIRPRVECRKSPKGGIRLTRFQRCKKDNARRSPPWPCLLIVHSSTPTPRLVFQQRRAPERTNSHPKSATAPNIASFSPSSIPSPATTPPSPPEYRNQQWPRSTTLRRHSRPSTWTSLPRRSRSTLPSLLRSRPRLSRSRLLCVDRLCLGPRRLGGKARAITASPVASYCPS